MTTLEDSEWAVISGFLFFLTIVFLILKALGIYDFTFIVFFKEYLTIIGILVIGFSYILGVIINETILTIVSSTSKLINKVLKRPVRVKNYIDERLFSIFEHGSQHIIKVIDIIRRRINLYRSLAAVTPLCGLSIMFWTVDTKASIWGWTILSISVLVSILCYFYYRIERRRYSDTISTVYRQLDISKRKSKQRKSVATQ